MGGAPCIGNLGLCHDMAVVVRTEAGESTVGRVPLKVPVDPCFLLVERVGLNAFACGNPAVERRPWNRGLRFRNDYGEQVYCQCKNYSSGHYKPPCSGVGERGSPCHRSPRHSKAEEIIGI